MKKSLMLMIALLLVTACASDPMAPVAKVEKTDTVRPITPQPDSVKFRFIGPPKDTIFICPVPEFTACHER